MSVREALQRWMLPISLIATAVLCASLIQVLTPRLKNVTIDDGVRRLEDVPFPFLRQTSAPVQEYHLVADIDYKPYQFTRLTLLPTLCLASAEINGKPLTLPSERCDFVSGYDVHLPIGPAGPLHLDAKISNPLIATFDVFGLSVRPPRDHPLVLILRLMASASLVAGLYLALRRWHFSPVVSLILVSSLPIQLLYQSHTPVTERTYDVLGHLQHIEYIAYSASLPPSAYCHECFQPGLYYVVASAVYSMARATRIFDPMLVLQFLSLVWFWVFLIMSARITMLWFPQQREVHLATSLLAFWPAGFLHSARVSNDIAFYAFFATSLYFLLSWWKTGSRKHLIIAASVAGCGVLIKTTIMPLIGAISILILYRIFSGRRASTEEAAVAACNEKAMPRHSGVLLDGRSWPAYLLALFVMVLGITVYLAQSALRGNIRPPFGDNSPAMYVGNSWKQYLVLNPVSYFTSPFVDSVRDGTGRRYFWNYMLKSSMFGDYSAWFGKPVQRFLALVMSPLLLALVLLFCIGVVRCLRRAARQSLPLLVVIAVSILSVFALRFYNPYSGNNDFRYIYPALIPIVLLLVEGTRSVRIGRALCFLFCGLSAAFYLTV
ncbi:MAG TPA: glycosyltransferase family 39 protein [Bryobacteraceae bacterium]|nr:glycosyltransferase family 39 protein [Bryobacteraceae bacterium]